MATNKKALMRYKILDTCFRNPGKRYFIEDLISACEKILREVDPESGGISRRQIFEDMAFMESAEGWSIELERLRDGKRVYYRYANTSFSINNMPLNEVEINQMRSALDILSHFRGMPQFEWMYELMVKLQQGIAADNQNNAIMEFDGNLYLKGIGYLGTLYNAIVYKKVLTITYQPFHSDTPFEVTIHPYYLKQYNNRWFLFGYNPNVEKSDWNLALDRINAVTEVRKKYQQNTEINWTEYFEDIIGVTKPEGAEPQKLILHFNGKTGKYIETKPLHGSQRANWRDDNTLAVNLSLIFNYELESLILSFGENVVVAEPAAFMEKIRTRLSKATKGYN